MLIFNVSYQFCILHSVSGTLAWHKLKQSVLPAEKFTKNTPGSELQLATQWVVSQGIMTSSSLVKF